MNELEASKLVAKLQADYPATDLTGPTGAEYAGLLAEFEVTDADVAIERLKRQERWLSMAALYEQLTSAREDRWFDEKHPVGLALPDVSPATPEEVNRILGKFWKGVGKLEESRARLQAAAGGGDSEARAELTREVVKAQIDAESHAIPKQRPYIPPPTDTTSCGALWGTRAVLVDGVKVCPNCRSPISEGCTVNA